MFPFLICGSFHDRDPEDEGLLSCGNSPRLIKEPRTKGCSFGRRYLSEKGGRGKNPYSSVGLDKFSSLLSDLEEKKKSIYLRKDSRDIMLVRFMYSGMEEVVPIIVKSKDRKIKAGAVGQRKDELGSGEVAERVQLGRQVTGVTDKEIATRHKMKTRGAWKISRRELGKTCYYVPIFTVLILLLLAIFGRSFTILCTSIGWYLVPILTGSTGGPPPTTATTSSSSPSSSGEGTKEEEKTARAAIRGATSPRGK